MKRHTVKIVVVEDEIILLRNIKKKLLSISPDFEILGDATNGKDAWELIEKLHPDVVFTDIRMPIMDGLELSRLILNKYPEIYTVIISGYDDFEYARTALTNKVYDYLLKPVKIDELEKILSSLHKLISQKKENLTYDLLESQLSGTALPVNAEEPFKQKNSLFSCFLVCFGNLQIHCSQYFANNGFSKQYNDFKWDYMVQTLMLPSAGFYVFPQRFDNVKLILTESWNTEPSKITHAIFDYLKAHFHDTTINIGYSHVPVAFDYLRTEYIRLRKLLFSSLIIGQSQIFTFGGPAISFPPAVLSSSTSQYLQSLIQTKNVSGFEQSLKHIFGEWIDKQYPQQWIEKILQQLLTVFQQCLYFSDEDYEQMKLSVFSSLESMPDLASAADDIIKELQHWIILNRTVPTEINSVIEKMDAYIRSHYREALNISELAQSFHFNHSYLTRIFKKEKGKSPLKLINELRIHDACELLMESSLSIREISEILGFTDQHYFSRIFKDFTGVTPKEYRTR